MKCIQIFEVESLSQKAIMFQVMIKNYFHCDWDYCEVACKEMVGCYLAQKKNILSYNMIILKLDVCLCLSVCDVHPVYTGSRINLFFFARCAFLGVFLDCR